MFIEFSLLVSANNLEDNRLTSGILSHHDIYEQPYRFSRPSAASSRRSRTKTGLVHLVVIFCAFICIFTYPT
jgi:hypothetical protein